MAIKAQHKALTENGQQAKRKDSLCRQTFYLSKAPPIHTHSHNHISLLLAACSVVRDNSALNICQCWPTMTLLQGQGHRNSKSRYAMHTSTVVPSLNAIAEILSEIWPFDYYSICQVWDAVVTLNEEQLVIGLRLIDW